MSIQIQTQFWPWKRNRQKNKTKRRKAIANLLVIDIYFRIEAFGIHLLMRKKSFVTQSSMKMGVSSMQTSKSSNAYWDLGMPSKFMSHFVAILFDI